MPTRTCVNCNSTFQSRVIINDKAVNLGKRKTCLICNPYNSGKGRAFKQRSWTDDQLVAAVDTSSSLTEILTKLNLRSAGGAHAHIKKHIQRLGLDISRYQKIYEDRRDSLLRTRLTRSFDEIFCENSKVGRATVKNYLLRNKLIPYQCQACSCDAYLLKDNLWFFNDKPLLLTIEHINGVANDNRLINLCWLCPNCHSQTDTFAGRNTNTAEKTKRRIEDGPITIAQVNFLTEINCHFCQTTFKPTHATSKFCSTECSAKSSAKAKYKITKEELVKLVQEHPVSKIGEMFDVSGGSVKKWCIGYGIPVPNRGYWAKLRSQKC